MVAAQFAIADILVFPLTRQGGQMRLLQNSDHLLRRFGRLELVDLSASEAAAASVRGEADRFLFAIDGAVQVELVDLRELSPSHGVRVQLTLDAAKPEGVLVPFGVALSMKVGAKARLLVLSTHSEEHSKDRAINSDELAALSGPQ
jgi:dTDP-4-dehydrorhamnose 3,5-epimerase-like enzyme